MDSMMSVLDPPEVVKTAVAAVTADRYLVTVYMHGLDPITEPFSTIEAAERAVEWMQADCSVTMITITDLIDNTRVHTWVPK